MKRWVWVWGPAVAQMAVIFGASSIPNLGELPGGISDKTGHFTGYAILGTVVVRALAGARWSGVTNRAAVAAMLVSSAYGASDEFHQAFVPGRTPDVNDWLADTSGAVAAVVVIRLAASVIARWRRGREV
ncbi:MAG TPA: VanZ family protein [Vicinamibacterales bacterium]|nr:VanZ family protein [Vicinamibacterales bacterium]